jgi:hypothetical protein
MKTNKLINDFFNISLSATKANTVYSNAEIQGYLVAISLNNDSLESATGLSPDTIQRRIMLGTKTDMPWFNHVQKVQLELVRYILRRNQRVRWSVVIDESLEPFFGNVEKLKNQLDVHDLPDFVSKYKVQRGATGSFHYVNIALYSKLGTFPIAVIPKGVGEKIYSKIEEILTEVKRIHREIILLADRGYGNQQMISLCQKMRVSYCIRLKKKGKLKTIKKNHRRFFWHTFGTVKFRVIMHKSHGRETFFFAVGKKGGSSQWFRLLYRDRWSIENLFKNCDKIQLRTNSRNTIFRLFCFVLSLFLMLLYQLKKLITRQKSKPIRKTLYDLFKIQVLVILRDT